MIFVGIALWIVKITRRKVRSRFQKSTKRAPKINIFIIIYRRSLLSSTKTSSLASRLMQVGYSSLFDHQCYLCKSKNVMNSQVPQCISKNSVPLLFLKPSYRRWTQNPTENDEKWKSSSCWHQSNYDLKRRNSFDKKNKIAESRNISRLRNVTAMIMQLIIYTFFIPFSSLCSIDQKPVRQQQKTNSFFSKFLFLK